MGASQLYKQAGNSVTVPVIKRIAENILFALSEGRSRESEEAGKSVWLISDSLNFSIPFILICAFS